MVTQGISTEQYRRHAAAELAARLHADGGWDNIGEVIGTADAIARYVEDGTKPGGDEEREEPFKVEVRWLDDEHIEIRVDDNVISEGSFDELGSDGLLAIEKAAVGVARALGVEPSYVGPGESE